MTWPCRLSLLLWRHCDGQVRPPPAVQLPKRYVCSGSVDVTTYTSVSTMTWSLCGWATRNWQSKGMLMSAKNCSRDVFVSRKSSQISLDEYTSRNVCKKLFGFFLLLELTCDYYWLLVNLMLCEIFVFKNK
jgi:hypothetical protein